MQALELVKDLKATVESCLGFHNHLSEVHQGGIYEDYSELLTEIEDILSRVQELLKLNHQEQVDQGLDNLDKLGIIKEYQYFLLEFKQSLTEDIPELKEFEDTEEEEGSGEESAEDTEELLFGDDIINLEAHAKKHFGALK